MRLLAPLAITLLVAGCFGDPDGDARGRVFDQEESLPACATLQEVARSNLAVVLATVTSGLGPDGAVVSAWGHGTVEVVRDGSPIADVALDGDGCGTYQPPSLGTFVFRAKPTDSTCSLGGNATIVQTADAGHVVRLTLDQPCA